MTQDVPADQKITLILGPYGRSMVTHLNTVSGVELVDEGPISRSINQLPSGLMTGIQINKNYIQSPELQMYIENQGAMYDQTTFSPFYNTPFYIQPDKYPALRQARMLESFAWMAKYCQDYLAVHQEEQNTPSMQNFIFEYAEVLDIYESVASRKNGRNKMANCIYELSFDPQMAINASEIAAQELIVCYNLMASNYQAKKNNPESALKAMVDYPLEYQPRKYFTGDVTFAGIQALYERNGTICMDDLTSKQKVTFWDNLNSVYDKTSKDKIIEVDERIKEFQRYHLDKNALF